LTVRTPQTKDKRLEGDVTSEVEPKQTGETGEDSTDTVKEWLALAWQHEKLAEFALSLDPLPRTTIVYQYRLVAENWLKALLESLGIHIPADNTLPILLKNIESCLGRSLQITDACTELDGYSGPERGFASEELTDRDIIGARKAAEEVAAVVKTVLAGGSHSVTSDEG
jgi:HEPN domain-containing protein